MNQKILKVYESTGFNSIKPRILLQEKWLEQLGYNIGDYIIVSYDQEQISIRLESKESL